MSHIIIHGPENQLLYERAIAPNETAHLHAYITVDKKEISLPNVGDEGIDVSRHNGNFDWYAVREKYKFAYVRVTMGAPSANYSGVDERWKYNRAGSRLNGWKDGVYHYVVNGVPTKDQFDNLAFQIGDDFGCLPIVLDVERRRFDDGPEPVDRSRYTLDLREFLERCEDRWRHAPMIYTSKLEWEAMTTLPSWANEYKFFVAQYAPTLTAVRPEWRVAVWQYSTTNNTLDRDRWLGGDAPLPVARHNFAPRKNQDVINLFQSVTPNFFIEWLTRAGMLNALAAARPAVYSGPDIEDLPGLTDAEKAALVAKL